MSAWRRRRRTGRHVARSAELGGGTIDVQLGQVHLVAGLAAMRFGRRDRRPKPIQIRLAAGRPAAVSPGQAREGIDSRLADGDVHEDAVAGDVDPQLGPPLKVVEPSQFCDEAVRRPSVGEANHTVVHAHPF